WAALWQGFRVPPFAADDVIRQARRYKSKRELTRAIRLVAKADLALRSNPPGKRLVLEKLVLDLCAEVKVESAGGGWLQEELPVKPPRTRPAPASIDSRYPFISAKACRSLSASA